MIKGSSVENVFASSAEKGNAWIRDLACVGDFDSQHQAYQVFRAVAHALREQLPIEASAHLAAQFPLVLKGVYYEGWRPDALHVHAGTLPEFYKVVASGYAGKPLDPKRMSQAFFGALALNISEGEMNKIKSYLNHKLRPMLPSTPANLAEAW